ncbi:LCP family protein [Halobacillus massiliensis]|uniref:LCP family glycopolymer transferase n=1 Tax=Halobacillus massiliensis TaxID=1926286 RepID=UPI0009E57060|nr:LCP family protein [Halobacillus massiliensis]
MSHKKLKSKTKRVRLLKVFLIITGAVVLTVGAFAFMILNDVRNTVNDKIYEEITSIDASATKAKIKNDEPVNILLLGVDERENDKGRSDTMIVMTLDPNNDQMQLFSIPRDTEAEIIGDGRTTRINHAYAYGGSNMAVDTVENFLDVNFDYFIKVNMNGLSQLVDSVNGITVRNYRAFTQDGYHFPEGQTTLSGSHALSYVRMRKEDPKGDLGRNERQRQVIEGIIEKGANPNMINQVGDVMKVLGDNVNTNMDFEDIRNLATKYRNARNHITNYQMSGSSKTSSGMYLIEMSEEEIKKTSNMINNFTLETKR